MRNPWGNRKTTIENENGQFFMDFNEYLKLMDYTYINYDTTEWSQDYFMMWDDPAEQSGTTEICGETCTQHRLFIMSDI